MKARYKTAIGLVTAAVTAGSLALVNPESSEGKFEAVSYQDRGLYGGGPTIEFSDGSRLAGRGTEYASIRDKFIDDMVSAMLRAAGQGKIERTPYLSNRNGSKIAVYGPDGTFFEVRDKDGDNRTDSFYGNRNGKTIEILGGKKSPVHEKITDLTKRVNETIISRSKS